MRSVRGLFGRGRPRKLEELRYYKCKLCGEVVEPRVVGVDFWGREVVVSAKTLMRKHLMEKHGKKSLKKKYVKKYSFYNEAKIRGEE